MKYPLAIMDYGIGGMDLFARIKHHHPDLPVLYFSDAGTIPYGRLDKISLYRRVQAVITYLQNRGAMRVVVACHSASTALVENTDGVMGMKDITVASVLTSQVKTVGIIGGGRTIRSGQYRKTLSEKGIEVKQRVAQELSILIERGELSSSYARGTVKSILRPLRGMEGLLLACTHYPAMQRLLGEVLPGTLMIDPMDHLLDCLQTSGWLDGKDEDLVSTDQFITTGNPDLMKQAARLAFGVRVPEVSHMIWSEVEQ